MEERAPFEQEARKTPSDLERQSATGDLAPMQGGTRTVPKGRRMSATVMRVARRLQRDADEIAKQIPDDTLRRTKYPVIEEVQPDGSILYKEQKVK
jgi:hypothetical protein